jgi:hypothetical protein
MSLSGVYLHGVAWFACLLHDMVSSTRSFFRRRVKAVWLYHVSRTCREHNTVRVLQLALHAFNYTVAWFACLPNDTVPSKRELLETPRQSGQAQQ